MYNGIFLSFEGSDGTGKTSIIKLVQKKIKNNFPKIKVLITSELGGTFFGKHLRKYVFDKKRINPLTRTYLFAAARAQNVEEVILPNLKDGNLIIADRYLDSSIVYQGLWEKVGIQKVKSINEYAVQNIHPQLVFVLYASSQKTITNIKRRKEYADNFDETNVDIKKQVMDWYIKLAQQNKKYVLIDANKDIDSTFQNVWEKIEPLILKHYC